MKKARGDSKLKTLPDALQEELFQLLRRTTLAKAADWLHRVHDIETTPTALSHFFDWYARQGWLRQSAAFADNLKATITKLPELKMTADQASQLAQVAFEIQAAQDRDPKLFLALQKGKINAKKLTLDERRVRLLEAAAALADQGKQVAADKDLTPEEQLSRFKQIFGGQ